MTGRAMLVKLYKWARVIARGILRLPHCYSSRALSHHSLQPVPSLIPPPLDLRISALPHAEGPGVVPSGCLKVAAVLIDLAELE